MRALEERKGSERERITGRCEGKELQVSIIVVSWNGKNLLEMCLSSLRNKTKYSNYSVIVVDNGSSDCSVELVRKEFPWVDIVALEKNYGYAVANNRGINYALEKYNPSYILLLNNDVEIVQEDWLRRIVETTQSNEDIGVAGCKLIYPDGRIQHTGTRIDFKGFSRFEPNIRENLQEVLEVDAVLGAFFLIDRNVIDTIGLLDEGFSPFQHEESDYCMRARKAGYRVCTVLGVNVVHFGGASMNRMTSDYYGFVTRKNEIRFIFLNFQATWLIRRLPYEFRTFLRCFITEDEHERFTLRKDWLRRTGAYAEAWSVNLRNLREIITKRRNRTAKIWPS